LSSTGAVEQRRQRRSEHAAWVEWAVARYAEWILSLSIDTKLIILFGSYAKGTFDEAESDIDILIVAEDLPEPPERYDLLTYEVPESIAHAVFEPHSYTPEEFTASLNSNGRAATALIEGQILYIDDEYRQELIEGLRALTVP
jgi:predicted nucleotidyltransferase